MRLYRPEVLDACAFVRAEAGLLAAAALGQAALLVTPLDGETLLRGRHQRATAEPTDGARLARRLGGGQAALVGRGSVGLALALPRADALSAGERFGPERVVNRHVRGLLRGLSRLGTPARYLGRDSVRVGPHAVALVSQDGAAAGAVLFEAIVGAGRPPVSPTGTGQEAWASLEVAPARAVERIISGYADVSGAPFEPGGALPEGPEPGAPLPGRYVVRPIAIGRLEACVRLAGGRIAAASFAGDLIAPASWLEATCAALEGCAPTERDVRAVVAGTLERADAALLGVLPEDLVLAVLGAAAEQT